MVEVKLVVGKEALIVECLAVARRFWENPYLVLGAEAPCFSSGLFGGFRYLDSLSVGRATSVTVSRVRTISISRRALSNISPAHSFRL